MRVVRCDLNYYIFFLKMQIECIVVSLHCISAVVTFIMWIRFMDEKVTRVSYNIKYSKFNFAPFYFNKEEGAQWLSGRVLDSRPGAEGPQVRASPASLRCGP